MIDEADPPAMLSYTEVPWTDHDIVLSKMSPCNLVKDKELVRRRVTIAFYNYAINNNFGCLWNSLFMLFVDSFIAKQHMQIYKSHGLFNPRVSRQMLKDNTENIHF